MYCDYEWRKQIQSANPNPVFTHAAPNILLLLPENINSKYSEVRKTKSAGTKEQSISRISVFRTIIRNERWRNSQVPLRQKQIIQTIWGQVTRRYQTLIPHTSDIWRSAGSPVSSVQRPFLSFLFKTTNSSAGGIQTKVFRVEVNLRISMSI
jgi:hypothetical protein